MKLKIGRKGCLLFIDFFGLFILFVNCYYRIKIHIKRHLLKYYKVNVKIVETKESIVSKTTSLILICLRLHRFELAL